MAQAEQAQPAPSQIEDDDVSPDATSFDHHNHVAMDQLFKPTVNNEHVINGYIEPKEVDEVKLDAKILLDMALIAEGDVDSETALNAYGAQFTLDRAIERGKGGFNMKMQGTTYHFEQGVYTTPKQGGLLSHLPFRKKAQPEPTAPPGR